MVIFHSAQCPSVPVEFPMAGPERRSPGLLYEVRNVEFSADRSVSIHRSDFQR